MTADRLAAPGQHSALTTQQHMRDIAELWPELHAALAGGSQGDNAGVHSAPGSRMPINAHVSDVIAEITDWVAFLTHILIDEATIETPGEPDDNGNPTVIREPWRPLSRDTRAILREIADTRVGHFTAHPDTLLADSITDDAARLHKLARNTARPSGKRKIPLHIPCDQYGTSDLGERVPCTGQLHTALAPNEQLGDFICNADPSHRISPLEWQRAQRHDPARDRDMDALMYGRHVLHTSERIGA